VGNAAEMTQITLGWNPSDESDVAGYNVYRRTAGNAYWKQIGTVENVQNPEFSLNVKYGKKNSFAVTAYDMSGNESSLSDQISWPVQLFSPNGGELIASGSRCPIQWYADSGAKEIKLLYTVNGGTSWRRIATLAGVRSYEWTVPEVVKRKTKCKVKVVLKGEGGVTLGSDVSDAYFTINPIDEGNCPCRSDVDNYCLYDPSTPGCPMTDPGGYCDPNGDGSFSDADWSRGYREFGQYCR
jgi:hypothetical protein